MKFHELAIGQKFEFQGVTYVKTTPMIASATESSTQKFMARSATIKLLDAPAPPAKPAPATLTAESVAIAFNRFYAGCLTSLQTIQGELSPDSFEKLQNQLNKDRDIFLDSL